MSSPNKLGSNGTDVMPVPEEVMTVVRTRTSVGLDQQAKASLETAATTPASPIPPEVGALKRGGTLRSPQPDTVRSREAVVKPTLGGGPINEIPPVVKRKMAVRKVASSRYVRDAVLIALAAAATYGITKYAGCDKEAEAPVQTQDETMSEGR